LSDLICAVSYWDEKVGVAIEFSGLL